jgi:uncharacterized membrane protein
MMSRAAWYSILGIRLLLGSVIGIGGAYLIYSQVGPRWIQIVLDLLLLTFVFTLFFAWPFSYTGFRRNMRDLDTAARRHAALSEQKDRQ